MVWLSEHTIAGIDEELAAEQRAQILASPSYSAPSYYTPDYTDYAAQDAAYFASALATSSTGVSRKTGVKAPITLPKDAYLILTIGGAAHASAGIMDVIVQGIDTGGN